MSSFSNAMIYIIFKVGTNLYDARSRILEQLSTLQGTFPSGSSVQLGVDATGVGWAYEYALKSKTKSLEELRTLQDYFYKFGLLGVDGVSEIATIGGFIKNYEITLNQDKLVQYDLNIEDNNIDIDEVDSVNDLVVNDKQVQTKRINSAIEDDIEFKNKLTNDDDLDEILNNSNLPSVVKEAYK